MAVPAHVTREVLHMDGVQHMARVRREHLRWQCLVYLDTVRPSTMMDSALLPLIRSGYPDATGIELRRALDYLELRGLLGIEKTDAGWGLRLTYQGIDVVDFTSACLPGIGRPSEP